MPARLWGTENQSHWGLVYVPVLKGTRGKTQLSFAGPKNVLLAGSHC